MIFRRPGNEAGTGATTSLRQTPESGQAPEPGSGQAPGISENRGLWRRPAPKHERGLTIRLKLTLWYGSLFLLAGVLLIAINFVLVRDSLVPAPDKAREYVEELYGLPEGTLEPPGNQQRPGPGTWHELRIEILGVGLVPVQALLDDAQHKLTEEALRQLWTWSLVALAIMTIITFGSAWFLAGRMLRPLHAITDTARRLSGSTLHERIALKGPRDELKDLADTFDEMLVRLDSAFTAQKEFVANASHELRTPLTIIRTEIEVALADPKVTRHELQEMGGAVTDAVGRSERLIDGLLVLARAEQSPTMVELDLGDIAQEEVSLASAEADDRGLRLELDPQPAPALGDRALLERLAANLIENAVRHNTKDGWFSVKTWSRKGRAFLEVANGGPVVSEDEVKHLFDRFYRPDKSRSRKTGGFGLGLSIVKSVVTAHDGTVEIEAPKEGGLRVTVSLPGPRPPGLENEGQHAASPPTKLKR
jgi:signal transduction histidine kinase